MNKKKKRLQCDDSVEIKWWNFRCGFMDIMNISWKWQTYEQESHKDKIEWNGINKDYKNSEWHKMNKMKKEKIGKRKT